MSPQETVIVGRFGAPYGIKGWLRLISFTDPAENIEHYQPWRVQSASGWDELKLKGFRALPKGFAAFVEGISDRDGAISLRGKEISIATSLLPDPKGDEIYWKDLIGLKAESPSGMRLGQVIGLVPAGTHDVLVIEPFEAGEPLLVPFERGYVPEVDIAVGRLVADVSRLQE